MKIQNSIDWLHEVRKFELEKLTNLFPVNKKLKILEIGSGSGFMISVLEKKYKNIEGLEIEGSAYESKNKKIKKYNGKHIPFKDNTFDVVFTSHVLEHIKEIDDFSNEISRVLKIKGKAFHVIPTPTWRFYTSIFHYFALVDFLIKFLKRSEIDELNKRLVKKSRITKLKMMFFAPRHGERGNVISELYYFSKTYWVKVFKRNGYIVESVNNSQIIYWGNDIFRNNFSIKLRSIFSKVFGSSSKIYVLKNEK